MTGPLVPLCLSGLPRSAPATGPDASESGTQVSPAKSGVDVDVQPAGGQLQEIACQRGCADRADAADMQRPGVLKHAATQVESRRRRDDPAWQVGDDISGSSFENDIAEISRC
jgi:hypothetical protein